MVIDRGVLLDEGVGSRHVSLRLVVVVIGDKILHGIFRKKITHFRIELRSQCLIGCHDDGRPLYSLDNIGDGKSLARTGYTQQCLPCLTCLQPGDQAINCRGLITGRRKFALQKKFFGHVYRFI